MVVVHPGGALAGPAVEVAGALDRLGGDRHDDLDHAAASAIRQFLTDPAAQDGTRWPATRPRIWSSPAIGYWLSGPTNQPSHDAHTPASWPGAPSSLPHPPIPLPDPAPSRPQHEPPDRTTQPTPTHWDPPRRRLEGQPCQVRQVRCA